MSVFLRKKCYDAKKHVGYFARACYYRIKRNSLYDVRETSYLMLKYHVYENSQVVEASLNNECIKNKSIDEIKDIFKSLLVKCVGKKDELVKKYLRLFDLTFEKCVYNQNFIDCYNNIICYVKNRKNTDFHSVDWIILSHLSSYLGLLQLSLACRQKRNEIVLDRKVNRYRGVSRLLIFMEHIDVDNCREEIEKIISYRGYAEKNKKVLIAAKVMISNLPFSEKKLVYDDLEADFVEYIKEKKILVIGPLDSCMSRYSVADGTLIIRLNDFQNEHNPLDETIAGLKTDISYFNGEYGDRYFYNYESNAKYDFVCLKNKNSVQRDYKNHLMPSIINSLMYLGRPNLLQFIIFDLINLPLSSVEIVGFDLFISKTIHGKYYQNNVNADMGRRHILYFTSVHNMISNFAFVKILYKRGAIEPHGELKRLLKMTVEEYVKLYEETRLYTNFGE